MTLHPCACACVQSVYSLANTTTLPPAMHVSVASGLVGDSRTYVCRTKAKDFTWPAASASALFGPGEWRNVSASAESVYPRTVFSRELPTHFAWSGAQSLRLGTLDTLKVWLAPPL